MKYSNHKEAVKIFKDEEIVDFIINKIIVKYQEEVGKTFTKIELKILKMALKKIFIGASDILTQYAEENAREIVEECLCELAVDTLVKGTFRFLEKFIR